MSEQKTLLRATTGKLTTINSLKDENHLLKLKQIASDDISQKPAKAYHTKAPLQKNSFFLALTAVIPAIAVHATIQEEKSKAQYRMYDINPPQHRVDDRTLHNTGWMEGTLHYTGWMIGTLHNPG